MVRLLKKENILIALVTILFLITILLSLFVLNIWDKLKGIEEKSKPVSLTKIEQRLDSLDLNMFDEERSLDSLGNDFRRIEKILLSLSEVELKFGQVVEISNKKGVLSLGVKFKEIVRDEKRALYLMAINGILEEEAKKIFDINGYYINVNKNRKETINIPSNCELYAAGQHGLVKVELSELTKIVDSSSDENYLTFVLIKGKVVQISQ